MVNADEFCQYARLGQISKIQKCLQTHNVDINALNLYGESALSTATYYNQIVSVQYLLANKADSKLRLAAGHTAVHIACRLANIPILHLLLSVKKIDEGSVEEQQDKHLYECLQIKDNANLTPVHWAATQESVSKRQKVFAYLDQRMPGVLDSRYNMNWFISWANTHPWVMEQKSTNRTLANSPVRLVPKLTNTDRINRDYCEQRSSLPFTDVTPLNMTPRTSLNDYERTSRPVTATTTGYYDELCGKNKRTLSRVDQLPQVPALPVTPITSCIVTSTNPISKYQHKVNEHCEVPKLPSTDNNITPKSQKTLYTQRLTSIVKHSLSPLTHRSTYRAERVHVIPPTLLTMTNETNQEHEYEDMITPLSSKRPSHNLLSNIVPSSTTPSSDQSSGQSTKPFASFGFDTSIDSRAMNDTTILSTIETYTKNNDESLYEDDDNDYLCKSASTLGLSTPGVST